MTNGVSTKGNKADLIARLHNVGPGGSVRPVQKENIKAALDAVLNYGGLSGDERRAELISTLVALLCSRGATEEAISETLNTFALKEILRPLCDVFGVTLRGDKPEVIERVRYTCE